MDISLFYGGFSMNENENKAVNEPDGTLTMKIDGTNYVIGLYFSKTSKETMKDKIEQLILGDIQIEKFL